MCAICQRVCPTTPLDPGGGNGGGSGYPPACFTNCNCPKNTWEEINYASAYLVNDFNQNCAADVNKQCLATEHQGCSLFAKMQQNCKFQPCTTRGFAYAGTYTGKSAKGCDHVITIAVEPIRGLDDVYIDLAAAKAKVGSHFQTFWNDSLAYVSGDPYYTNPGKEEGKEGFKADEGALVINPAAHREYHQLHIHGGTWRTPVFDKCLAQLEVTNDWKTFRCVGLSEDGDPTQRPSAARLAYKLIDQTALGSVWDEWKYAVDTFVKLPEPGLHTGLMVTRRPYLLGGTPALPSDKVFVIAYFPDDANPRNGLGRGHFLKQNLKDSPCT